MNYRFIQIQNRSHFIVLHLNYKNSVANIKNYVNKALEAIPLLHYFCFLKNI